MYNGVGLATARGSGTNGFVQRNFAQVRNIKEKVDYKSEEAIRKTEALLHRPPNQDILAHERKRQVEIKCFEMRELLEEQGQTEEECNRQVGAFRKMLMEKEGVQDDEPVGKTNITDTHQLAEAKQKQNEKLREAFGISKNYVEGSAFDPERRANEAAAKAMATKKYDIIKEPDEEDAVPEKKKKRDSSRSESDSSDRKHKKKKKKSHKKHKRSHNKGEKKSHKKTKVEVNEGESTTQPEGGQKSDESGVESAGSSPDRQKSKSHKKKTKSKKRSHSPKSLSPHKEDKKKTKRESHSRSRSPHRHSRSRSHSRNGDRKKHRSRSRSHSYSPSERHRSRSRSPSYSPTHRRRSASRSRSPQEKKERKKSFSPIRKRRDSPSFLDRRRITRSRSRDRRRYSDDDDDDYSRRRRSRSRSRDYRR